MPIFAGIAAKLDRGLICRTQEKTKQQKLLKVRCRSGNRLRRIGRRVEECAALEISRFLTNPGGEMGSYGTI